MLHFKIAVVSCFTVLGLVACGTDTNNSGVALKDSSGTDSSIASTDYSLTNTPPATVETPEAPAPKQKPPAPKPVVKKKPPAPAPEPEPDCHSSYEGACLKPDASDYDCKGGSGNGPYYVQGPIKVVGPDEYDLDSDNDGIGCES